jgi:hypothetical protein
MDGLPLAVSGTIYAPGIIFYSPAGMCIMGVFPYRQVAAAPLAQST